MPTLTRDDLDGPAKDAPGPLQAVNDSSRWTARCMHRECDWKVAGLLSEDSATTAAQLHADSTGHPVNLRAVIEFDCGIVRSKLEAIR